MIRKISRKTLVRIVLASSVMVAIGWDLTTSEKYKAETEPSVLNQNLMR